MEITPRAWLSSQDPQLGVEPGTFRWQALSVTASPPSTAKVNFTYRETHSLLNAREVTQFHQSQVESHNIRYDSPTKPSECIPTAEPLQFTDKTHVSNIIFMISKSRENRTRYVLVLVEPIIRSGVSSRHEVLGGSLTVPIDGRELYALTPDGMHRLEV